MLIHHYLMAEKVLCDGGKHPREYSDEEFPECSMFYCKHRDPKLPKAIYKDNNLDDYDTEYVDIDILLQMYLDEFRAAKRDNMIKLSKYYKNVMVEQLKENESAMLTFANVTKINSDFRMAKAQKTPT